LVFPDFGFQPSLSETELALSLEKMIVLFHYKSDGQGLKEKYQGLKENLGLQLP
jgi:hypothetical protein